jgi:hypothetical protein
MKTKYSALLTAVLMVTPLSLLAAQHSENVTFSDALTVGGTQVPAGTYRVQWDGTGKVTATINKGKKTVVSVPATVVASKSNYDAALDTQGNVLQAIEFKNETLQFDQAGSATPTAGN